MFKVDLECSEIISVNTNKELHDRMLELRHKAGLTGYVSGRDIITPRRLLTTVVFDSGVATSTVTTKPFYQVERLTRIAKAYKVAPVRIHLTVLRPYNVLLMHLHDLVWGERLPPETPDFYLDTPPNKVMLMALGGLKQAYSGYHTYVSNGIKVRPENYPHLKFIPTLIPE